jgi:hypothetical protein
VYKPNCIYYHPEGQRNGEWQTNTKKTSKICRYAESGFQCMRSECYFFHPARRNDQGFHWEQLIEPPIKTANNLMTSTAKIPVRIPVIVRNQKMMKKYLSQSLKGLALD